MKTTALASHNSIGQRLKHEMQKRGIKSPELAKRAAVKTSFLYDVISGKSTNPSTVTLARVAESLGVNLTWLVGSTEIAAKNIPADYIAIARLAVDANSQVVSLEPSGDPCYFHISWLKERCQTNPQDMRMLTVCSDNMAPTLCHNDMVLIDTTRRTPSPPGMFVLFDGSALVVKRLEYIGKHHPPRLRVMSDNPHYSTYECESDDAVIIGRVTWFARDI